MSSEFWVFAGILVTVAGQTLTAYWMYHAKHSIQKIEEHTNGMQQAIVKAERKDARDQERAVPTEPDRPNV